MKLISRLRDERYCAFCRSPRRLYVKKHVDLTNVVGVLLVSLAITQAAWGGPDPRGAVLFLSFIVTGEVFIYLRWRASVVCRLCGFDPVIYKRSPERAATMVNQFFREQAENPQFWLSKSPLLDVHRRLREEEKKRQELALIRQLAQYPRADRDRARAELAASARSRNSSPPAAPR